MGVVEAVFARAKAFTVALGTHEDAVLRMGMLEGVFYQTLSSLEPTLSDEAIEIAATENEKISAARQAVGRSRHVVLAYVRALVLGVEVDAAHLARIAAGDFDGALLPVDGLSGNKDGRVR